jgi:phosphoserine phosphatase
MVDGFSAMLAAFDFDGTLIPTEPMVELARLKGCEERVRALTYACMGKDFYQGLVARIALLQGLEKAKVAKLAKAVRPREGVRETFDALHDRGFEIAIITGGHKQFVEAARLPADYVFCNELLFEAGRLYSVRVTVGGVDDKERIFKALAAKNGFSIACGDGPNDQKMLDAASESFAVTENTERVRAKHYITRIPQIMEFVRGLA